MLRNGGRNGCEMGGRNGAKYAFVGTVSPQVLAEVREALLFALGFDHLEAE